MKTLLALMIGMFLAGTFCVFLSNNNPQMHERLEQNFRSDVAVRDWLVLDATYEVIEVQALDGLEMRRAILKRSDGILFAAMASSGKKLPLGSFVKVAEIQYAETPYGVARRVLIVR